MFVVDYSRTLPVKLLLHFIENVEVELKISQVTLKNKTIVICKKNPLNTTKMFSLLN